MMIVVLMDLCLELFVSGVEVDFGLDFDGGEFGCVEFSGVEFYGVEFNYVVEGENLCV